MKISIVTLSFNQRRFLDRAIQSIVSQGYEDLEYIVIDPGSTDGSRDLLHSHSNTIAHLVLEADRGPADGLNKGFNLATGEIYGLLNADDFLLPGSLNLVATHFSTHRECDVVMGNGFIVDDNERRLRSVHARPFSLSRWLHGSTHWLQPSIFFRASAFRAVGCFNIDNRTCWDGELFLKMGQLGANFQFLPEDLACFRIHKNSITGQSAAGRHSAATVAYFKDKRRMFEESYGRKWDLRDDILSLGYRIEHVLLYPQDAWQALLHRARTRFR